MMRQGSHRRPWRLTFVTAAVGALLALLALAPAALAGGLSPKWDIESRPAPTNMKLEGRGLILVTVSDLGGPVDAEAHEITVTDTLPAGVELNHELLHPITAKGEGTPRSLSDKGSCNEPAAREPIVCKFKQNLTPYEEVVVYLNVKTHFPAPAEPDNEVTVTGGGAPEATLKRPLKINGQETKFGVEQYELLPEATETHEGSEILGPDTQAGSHPYQLTTTFNLNQLEVALNPRAPALQRNLNFQLPPGFIGDANVVGNPNAPQQCTGVDFGAVYEGSFAGINGCPPDSVIGMASFTLFEPNSLGLHTYVVPVFNLVPTPGEPAKFGFAANHVPIVLDTSIRTGGNYAVTVSVHDATQVAQVLGSRVTIWGAPEDSSHDEARGWACLGYSTGHPCEPANVKNPTAFLTLPTSCSSVPTTSVTGESWPHEEGREVVIDKIGQGGAPNEAAENATYEFPSAFTGCGPNLIGFEPSLTVEPEEHETNTPTGLTTRVRVPQQSSLEEHGVAQSAIKDTTVEFPQGVLLNPAAATGLQACLEGESEAVEGVGSGGIGFTGNQELGEGFEGPVPTYTEKLPELVEPGVNFCANASKVGEVHIKTPDLPNELVGGVYTAAQNANPFGSLFGLYIVAQDPVSKVLVKAAGEVKLNPTTGQITTTFANTPDVPFEELRLELFKGPRAPLTTPPTCGETEMTKVKFTAWAHEPGEPLRTKTEEVPGFNQTEGAEKSGCASTPPLAPSFQAGSVNTQAGAFSPFELTIGHPDADQPITGLTTTLPAGLAAVIASVTPCEEPYASQGTCGEASKIGKAEASVGLGSEPFTQKEGRVYLTGPYEGAPFGLSVVVPTKAGPFNFGNVVTRSTINVNPETAAVTINSPLPTWVNTTLYPQGVGVAVQLKSVRVVVDREHFQFNPTNCAPQSIAATITGAQGGSANVSSSFQATGCDKLTFAPKFSASVAAQGSKADGTSFTATVESGGIGVEGIRKVFLTVPKLLPARLKPTLQNACLDTVFAVNPAGCPEDAFIGMATVYTPVLKTPLRGPAILVSHGNAAFPDVEFVLQSENIHILLDGKTNIKKGVTYSRFESAPDAPFTKFVSEFPAGPHSIFTDNTEEGEAPTYNLCGKNIMAPTELTAQDGAVIKQETKLTVVGCVAQKLTNAQLLAKALKACKKDKKKSKRQACERAARKKYGPKSKKHTGKKPGKKTSKKKH